MTGRAAHTELLGSERFRGDNSEALSYLIAEGINWAANEGVRHDESKPMGRFLARLDELEVIPRGESYIRWLESPQAGLAGLPIDYVIDDDLEPLERLLDQYAERSGDVHLAGHGSDRI